MTTTTTTALATDKQLAFADRLFKEREVPVAGATPEEGRLIELAFDMGTGKDVTRKEASQVIDYLLSLPKPAPAPAAPAAPAVALTEGIYITPPGDIIKVKNSKAGKPYALVAVDITGKRLTLAGDVVKYDFVYTPGIIKHITPDMRMTQEQAAHFGTRYSKCIWCGRKLKAAESVIKSIGPVCIKRFA